MSSENYNWPGVYPSINDLSGVVSTNSVTSCAYVGEAEFGPINEPTLLGSSTDYVSIFGTISSRYGYAGYSLAVASESIGTHYFVRTVHLGDAEAQNPTDDAQQANCFIAKSGGKEVAPLEHLYTNSMLLATENDAVGEMLFYGTDTKDESSAFAVVASNPNNRTFHVSLSDTTINENKVRRTTSLSSDGSAATLVITNDGNIAVGDTIIITDANTTDLIGSHVVTGARVVDANVELTIAFTGNIASGDSCRVQRDVDNDEKTFSLSVYETIGRTRTRIEYYQYLTLYPAKDNYGSSMYIEDVINGSSPYINVYVNPYVVMDSENVADYISPETTGAIIDVKNGVRGISPSDAELLAGWDLFSDRTQVTVSLLMNSGYVSASNVAYQAKMLEIAENRRDCFCLFDAPMTETEANRLMDWVKNIQGFNTYRAALSSPWVKTYDSVQGRSNFIMCPSAFLAKIIGEAGDPWIAPAGPNRGVIGSSTVSPTGLTQSYSELVGGILYADNHVNCLVKNVGSGYVNWGQRTLQAKPSALDRINVARTIIQIETILRDVARWHLFENNTSYQRLQLTMQFSSYLNTVLSAGGIQQFRVVCDETNNTPIVIANNQMMVELYIWPTYTAEVIILKTNVMGADTSVSIDVI